jgi:asparagine N-glycosylation enzyme membrane subunit Stt3
LFRTHKLNDCKYSSLPCYLENVELNLDYCQNFYSSNAKIYCEAIVEQNHNKCNQIKTSLRDGPILSDKCKNAFFDQIYADSIFEYEKNDKRYTSVLLPEFKPSMEWVKNNLPQDIVIASWWDYGHIIRGIGSREAIVYTPSEEILDTVSLKLQNYFPPENLQILFTTKDKDEVSYLLDYWNASEVVDIIEQSDVVVDIEKYDTDKKGKLSKNEDIKNVALILTTTNPKEAINLMKQYNSDYILVTYSENTKAYILFQISGIPTSVVPTISTDVSELNKNSIFYKMLKLQQIDGFKRVYSDPYLVIYKMES